MTGRRGAHAGRPRCRANSMPSLPMRSSGDESEPRAKKTKEEAAAEELSALLSQPAEILVHICNYLDPDDLLELAESCKYLYNFIRKAKGINVVYPLDKVRLEASWSSSGGCMLIDKDSLSPPCILLTCLQKLQPWPISVHINELEIGAFRMTQNEWEFVKSRMDKFLVRYGVKRIRCLKAVPTPSTVQEVDNVTIRMVKAFGVEEIEFETNRNLYREGLSREAMEALLKMPLAKFKLGWSDMGDLDDDILLNCCIPVVAMGKFVTLTGLHQIIQIWKSRRNLESWQFRYRFDSNQFMDYFNRFEIRGFKYTGPIDRWNSPIFLKIGDNGQDRATISVFFLREDGKVVSVTMDPSEDDEVNPFIEFRMCPLAENPLALRNIGL